MDERIGITDKIKSGIDYVVAKVNRKNKALRDAVISGDLEKVRKLLEEGADPNYRPLADREILVLLAYKVHKKASSDILKLLVQHGLNRKSLHEVYKLCVWSVFEAQVGLEIMELMLANGLSADETGSFPMPDMCGYDNQTTTLLQFAVSRDKPEMVGFLLDRGADVHQVTRGQTRPPLHLALWESLDVIKLLLKKGADVNRLDGTNARALHLSCSLIAGNVDKIRTLLDYGADVLLLDRNQKCPLAYTRHESDKQHIIIKELALAMSKGRHIGPEISSYLKINPDYQVLVEECFDELEAMKSVKMEDCGLTLYDVLKTRRSCEKLIFATKRAGFVEDFKALLQREKFEHLESDLLWSVNEAQRIRLRLENEEEMIKPIFKNKLPEIVIRKIALFVAINLHYE